ncbi:MAG TPA: bifunctional 3-(3-hydroxy-phenyl)propionate/3-hydroxycinnamic acid hydroxylase, partial [Rhodothermales bacterium]|nr:bifunctional 3-(3-hydroxy-phenyl)propionate/3-hydroxycinnamic acid hydroxylase [Rhodothermales bacterium]
MPPSSPPLDANPYDVAVVGYGPVGAAAANLLGAAGHRVIVLERESEIHPLPRAVHFDGEVMRFFQLLGLSDAVEPLTGSADEYRFEDRQGRLLFSVDRDRARQPEGWPRLHVFRQPDLEGVLRAGVARYPTVTVRLGAAVEGVGQDDAGVTLDVRAGAGVTAVRARYVLACDGARSTVRDLLHIPLRVPGRGPLRALAGSVQPWLVVDARLTGNDGSPGPLRQVCDPQRPTTYIPGPGRQRRWEFLLRGEETTATMEKPARVRALLAPWVDPDAVEIERAAVYTFRALVAARWRAGRVFLAGDAAHQMPPFAGQGLGSGLRDAHNAAWKLDLVLRGVAPPALLDTYEQERRPHVAAITWLALAAGRLLTLGRSFSLLRDGLLWAVNGVSKKPLLAQLPIEMPGLRRGFFARGDGRRGAGTRFPQPVVRVLEGGQAGPTVRLDEVLGPGFALLGAGAD